MSTPAFVVLLVALVCSTFGVTTEQTDRDSIHKIMIKEPSQTLNLNYTDINMKTTRTNVHEYRLNKDYFRYGDSNISKFDDIYNDGEDFREDSIRYFGEEVRQYKLKDDYERILSKSRVKREDSDKCASFKLNNMVVDEAKITHPHEKGQKTYYRDLDCILKIEANDDQVIELTFVDFFHIEDHAQCKYDFLEIRDGYEGYANLLGKLCGETFPSKIRSSGPHLWLKFHSDKTIEFGGFHIQVKFEHSTESRKIPPKCIMEVKKPYGIINSNDVTKECIDGSSKNQGLDVLWSITAEENRKIYLNFTSYALVKPNECEENIVQVFGSILESDASLAQYCGSAANPVMTRDGDGPHGKEKGNIMHIRMYKSKNANKSNFTATYNTYRTVDPGGDDKCNGEVEFDCEDNTCIPNDLKCDQIAHCRLKADEDPALCEKEAESVINDPDILAILVIFSLILSGMIFVFLFKCIKKFYQDHKIIKQKNIIESCEDRLDYLTDSRFNLNVKKPQLDFTPRASLERENIVNEMFKQQSSSINCIFIEETQLDEETPWRKEVDIPNEAHKIKIERNGRTITNDLSKKEESIKSKRDSEESKLMKEIRDISVGVPDMKESGCQTRESLFQEPAPSSDGSGSNGAGFSTFGYSGASIARPSPAPTTTNTSQITIELQKQVPPHLESKPQRIADSRPMSTETTRSAPDVIIVSKPIG